MQHHSLLGLRRDLRHTEAHRLMGRPTADSQKPKHQGAALTGSRSKEYKFLLVKETDKWPDDRFEFIMCPVGRGDNFSYIPETACAKGVNDKPVLPMNKRSLCFHKFQSELSLSSLVRQLSSSTLTKPFEKKTPKILILFTHLRPKGVSPLVRHLPSHISSDLEVFNLAPEPNSNLSMTSSREERDLSDLIMLLMKFYIKGHRLRGAGSL